MINIKTKTKKPITKLIIACALLVGTSIIAGLYLRDFIMGLRVVFGSLYILFFPGLLITIAAFPHRQLEIPEYVVFSFAFSITIVPLASFYLNLIGVPFSAVQVFLTVTIISLMAIIYAFIQKKLRSRPVEKAL